MPLLHRTAASLRRPPNAETQREGLSRSALRLSSRFAETKGPAFISIVFANKANPILIQRSQRSSKIRTPLVLPLTRCQIAIVITISVPRSVRIAVRGNPLLPYNKAVTPFTTQFASPIRTTSINQSITVPESPHTLYVACGTGMHAADTPASADRGGPYGIK